MQICKWLVLCKRIFINSCNLECLAIEWHFWSLRLVYILALFILKMHVMWTRRSFLFQKKKKQKQKQTNKSFFHCLSLFENVFLFGLNESHTEIPYIEALISMAEMSTQSCSIQYICVCVFQSSFSITIKMNVTHFRIGIVYLLIHINYCYYLLVIELESITNIPIIS